MLILPDSVDNIRENRDLTSGGSSASRGAIIEGRLKDAKMVRLSLRAKRANEILGTAAAGDADGAPNILAKHESLYTHRLIFTDDAAKNFVVLGATVDAGFDFIVEEMVSTALAVEYVAKYRLKIRRKGFEKTNLCGRVRAGRSERQRQEDKEAPLAAFSTIDLCQCQFRLEWFSFSPGSYCEEVFCHRAKCTTSPFSSTDFCGSRERTCL